MSQRQPCQVCGARALFFNSVGFLTCSSCGNQSQSVLVDSNIESYSGLNAHRQRVKVDRGTDKASSTRSVAARESYHRTQRSLIFDVFEFILRQQCDWIVQYQGISSELVPTIERLAFQFRTLSDAQFEREFLRALDAEGSSASEHDESDDHDEEEDQEASLFDSSPIKAPSAASSTATGRRRRHRTRHSKARPRPSFVPRVDRAERQDSITPTLPVSLALVHYALRWLCAPVRACDLVRWAHATMPYRAALTVARARLGTSQGTYKSALVSSAVPTCLTLSQTTQRIASTLLLPPLAPLNTPATLLRIATTRLPRTPPPTTACALRLALAPSLAHSLPAHFLSATPSLAALLLIATKLTLPTPFMHPSSSPLLSRLWSQWHSGLSRSFSPSSSHHISLSDDRKFLLSLIPSTFPEEGIGSFSEIFRDRAENGIRETREEIAREKSQLKRKRDGNEMETEGTTETIYGEEELSAMCAGEADALKTYCPFVRANPTGESYKAQMALCELLALESDSTVESIISALKRIERLLTEP